MAGLTSSLTGLRPNTGPWGQVLSVGGAGQEHLLREGVAGRGRDSAPWPGARLQGDHLITCTSSRGSLAGGMGMGGRRCTAPAPRPAAEAPGASFGSWDIGNAH